MPTRKPRKLVLRSPIAKLSAVLDVYMTGELLSVSPDTVYDLFKKLDCCDLGWLRTVIREPCRAA
jgi:hypothetical protein